MFLKLFFKGVKMGEQPPSVFNNLSDVYNNKVKAEERFSMLVKLL